MALADRIRECRTNLGFSQAELAERIHVSRQAVTKWESGKGYPDIDNLKAMSVLFAVSVDYLLDEEPGPITDAKMRVPIDLDNLTAEHTSTGAKHAKYDVAVRQVFPTAIIKPLRHRRKNTKSESVIEWIISALNYFIIDVFGIFDLRDRLEKLNERYYLVEEKNRQLLATVTPEAVIAEELSHRVDKKFRVGQDAYRVVNRTI
ncbi:helix-turn-helix domain-containing protein [Arcanobacterium hippocoleae]|uniref:Transcriptional regulator with XRE-family HTH domain n=1 Tax=Arcanobacterium hippocoleae TaxID=149017 RepID=A0ABU1T1Y5_9ACTO|nr:helix-turn-helix domain-containing protein [Arcanobacterium hippocoleae]MDR6939385.1 transcriptional regulator with XRE-family HTH domain [Arcanobacterium hippocoleae]